MFLKELQLFHYKNHESSRFVFSEKINAITGKNGIGKTNVLDAIYFLANAKSYFNSIDNQLIQFNKEFFTIAGKFEDENPFELILNFGKTTKKTIKKNGKLIKRIIDHIGQIQTVFITPNDISLIYEGSEERRKFIDFTICQLNPLYLSQLVEYRKVVEQRNSFLKTGEGRYIDDILLESYNHKLIPLNQSIHQTRKNFLAEFIPHFNKTYQEISNSSEFCDIRYKSSLNEASISSLFEQNYRIDIASQRTTDGIHKDDLEFLIHEIPIKKYGSQGQIKSFVVALKLAQYEYLKSKTSRKPILLLDDIFEKIDEQRSNLLMKMVCSDQFGQIFVSDTHIERVRDHFKDQNMECTVIELPLHEHSNH